MLEGIISRIGDTKEHINELQDRVVGIPKVQKEKKRNKKNQNSLKALWDNIKYTIICRIGVPEREEREKGAEILFEEMIAENFPYMGKETEIQIQEAQSVPNKIKPRGPHQDKMTKCQKLKREY